jgi:hypothetical protein
MQANQVNLEFASWSVRGIGLSQWGLSQERDYDLLESGFT